MLKSIALATTLVSAALSSSPDIKSPTQNLDTFEKLFGVSKGKRRNHTKGFCIVGEFTPLNSSIKELSNSPIFTGISKVDGRVSHKGGKLNTPDNNPGHYGLAFRLTAPNGSIHMMSLNTEHFFPTSTVESFMDFLEAQADGPEAAKDYVKRNPEIQEYKRYHSALQKQLTPYEGASYNSINTFYLVNNKGKKTPVRWSFIPSAQHSIVTSPSPNFLLDNMKANISSGGVSWDMVESLGIWW